MTATTHANFDEKTEALDVAAAFAEGVRGKTVLVTGANRAGIGFATAEAFASQSPAHLILVGRSTARIHESIDPLRAKYPDVDYRPLVANLSSQKSVRAAAAELISWSDVPVVNIVVNSAGIMLIPERTLSEEGIELQFATNHIGHFLFTNLIMPKLIKAAEGSPKGATRIVNVSSGSPMGATMRWSDINFEKVNKDLPQDEQPNYAFHSAWGVTDTENKSYIPLEGYNQSKVANVLFGVGANKRLYEKYGILSLGLHPGVIKTELGRSAVPETLTAIDAMAKSGVFTYKTLGAGAATSLVAALDPKLGVGGTKNGKENYGAFLADCQISDQARAESTSSAEAEKLWKLSEKLVNDTFAW